MLPHLNADPFSMIQRVGGEGFSNRLLSIRVWLGIGPFLIGMIALIFRAYAAAGTFAALASNVRHMLAILADGFATLAPDPGHVIAVAADGLTAFTSSVAGFVRRKLVSRTFLVGRPTTLACDLALFFLIHRGKPTSFVSSHQGYPFQLFRHY